MTVHEIGCPLPVPTGIPALPVIGYGHGYAQGERAGNGWVHFRSGTGTGTGMGGNIEEAGEYGYGYKYEYEHKYSYKYQYEHGWQFSVAQQSAVVVSPVKNYHKSFANIDNECN